MTQTHFAFVVEQPGHAMHGADVIIQAPSEDEADRLATVRSRIYAAPLRRAVARDIPDAADAARKSA